MLCQLLHSQPSLFQQNRATGASLACSGCKFQKGLPWCLPFFLLQICTEQVAPEPGRPVGGGLERFSLPRSFYSVGVGVSGVYLAAKNLSCSVLTFAGDAFQTSVVCTAPSLLAELDGAQQAPPCTTSCPAGFSGKNYTFNLVSYPEEQPHEGSLSSHVSASFQKFLMLYPHCSTESLTV